MPILGFGVFLIPEEKTTQAVHNAIACGYRLLDTAAAYNNERCVGAAVTQSGIDRSEFFITTKIWPTQFGYDNTFLAFASSLKKLKTEYIDLYLIHYPVPEDFQKTLETWKAMSKILSEGRVRAIGVCNFNSRNLDILINESGIVPAVNQVELHPFYSQRILRAYHQSHGIITQAWSPLGGVRTYGAFVPDADKKVASIHVNSTLLEIGTKYGKTPSQIVLRWMIQSGISANIKTLNLEHLKANMDVFDFSLSIEDIEQIEKLDTVTQGGIDPQTVTADTFAVSIVD